MFWQHFQKLITLTWSWCGKYNLIWLSLHDLEISLISREFADRVKLGGNSAQWNIWLITFLTCKHIEEPRQSLDDIEQLLEIEKEGWSVAMFNCHEITSRPMSEFAKILDKLFLPIDYGSRHIRIVKYFAKLGMWISNHPTITSGQTESLIMSDDADDDKKGVLGNGQYS